MSSRPRIAIDARKIRDYGIGTYLENLLRGLAQLEGDEEYVVFLPPGAAAPRSPRFTARTARARGYGLAEHVTLPVLARRARVNVYHTPHYVLPYFTPGARVVTIHDLIHLHFPGDLSRAARLYARHFLARAWRAADLVLTGSETAKQDLLQTFGGSSDHVRVTPHVVHEIFFRDREAAEIARVRARLHLGRPYVLYAGNVKPHKNLERLIAAFALLRESLGADAPELALTGATRESAPELRARARELGIEASVHFLGRLAPDDLACVFRGASVFAFPSLYEGFGLPPLEAMASGVPVVCSDASSLPEVCGDAALLVDATDTAALAAALERLLLDSALREVIRDRGLARARSFDHKEQARRTLDAYRSVL